MKTHVDLFSGIGGFALAAHWAGFTTEVFCERDPYCQTVLHQHWPSVPVIPDIREFDGRQYTGADLLTGGFPCQPYSCAGKQRGSEDDRALWPEMRRVIGECRPHWIVGENVPGIIGMALDSVLADLESEGYAAQAFVIPACAVNAPHRRERVFIVANTQRSDGQSGQSERPGIRHSFIKSRTDDNAGRSSDQRETVAHAHRKPVVRTPESWSERSRRQSQSGLGDMVDGLPARMAGHFDSDPAIPRVSVGAKNRAAQLKALGNSIVPQVAYEILRHIGAAP